MFKEILSILSKIVILLIVLDKIKELFNLIKEVNVKLWNVEDKLRVCEKNKDFGKNTCFLFFLKCIEI